MNIHKGSVAVITGGGGGIGRALAIELAGKGCNLALVDIDMQALEESKKALMSYTVVTSLHQTDISQADHVVELAKQVLEIHSSVNILINNAGLTLQKSFATHTAKDWQRVMGVNLMGAIHCCNAFLPALKNSGSEQGAHIINLSSLAAFVGLPNQSSYCLTKAALRSLSETLYVELKEHGIGVTSVHPGAIKTNILRATLHESDDIEVAKLSQKLIDKIGNTPEYAAKRIVRAIEKGNVRIRIGKDSVVVDLVKRLFPSGFSRRIAAMSQNKK